MATGSEIPEDPKSLPPCKLDIPMPVCTSELREAMDRVEAGMDEETAPLPLQETVKEEPTTMAAAVAETAEEEKPVVAEEAVSQAATVECPGFIVLSNYEAMLNGTLEDSGKPGEAAVEVAVASAPLAEVTEAEANKQPKGKAKSKRQRKDERFQPGRPWKQPARYIKYVPPMYQRMEWWEPVPRPGVLGAASSAVSGTVASAAAAAGVATAAGCANPEVAASAMATAEIEESEEWHFRCVCGVVAHWDDTIPKRLIGRQFECEGCACWAHTDCYPRYRGLSDAQLEADSDGGKDQLLCFACAGKK